MIKAFALKSKDGNIYLDTISHDEGKCIIKSVKELSDTRLRLISRGFKVVPISICEGSIVEETYYPGLNESKAELEARIRAEYDD